MGRCGGRRRPAWRRPTITLEDRATEACHAEGVVVLTCGTDGNVLRLLPPLVMPEALLEEGLSVLDTALTVTAS